MKAIQSFFAILLIMAGTLGGCLVVYGCMATPYGPCAIISFSVVVVVALLITSGISLVAGFHGLRSSWSSKVVKIVFTISCTLIAALLFFLLGGADLLDLL
jgi:hypothetical protein